MNIFTSLSQKTRQSFVVSILILSVLVGMLSACTIPVFTPTPIGEAGEELTPVQVPPATQEATLASPTEAATEMPTLTLTPELTAIQEKEMPSEELTLASPIDMATQRSIITLTPDLTVATKEMPTEIMIQKPTKSGINYCTEKSEKECIYNEQLANEFVSKNIPLESDLKFLRDGINQEVFSKSMIFDQDVDNPITSRRQAILIGGFIEDDNFFVYAGIEGDNGIRVILPMRANFGHIEEYSINKIAYQIDISGENKFVTNAANIVQVDSLDFMDILNKYLGKVCIINMELYIDINRFEKDRPELAQLLRDIYESKDVFNLNRIVAENPTLLKDSTGDNYPYITYFQFFNN